MIYWKFISKANTIGRKLHENVVQTLVAEMEQQSAVYASLLLKFDELVSLMMRQDDAMHFQCLHTYTGRAKASTQSQHHLVIFHISLRRILRKYLAA